MSRWVIINLGSSRSKRFGGRLVVVRVLREGKRVAFVSVVTHLSGTLQ